MGCCYSIYLINQLRNLNMEVPFFDLNGQTHLVKVVNVYDGDTCHVIMKFSYKFYKFKVRALGYDSPEIKPSVHLANRDKIKEKAIDSRNYLISRITDIHDPSNLSKEELKEHVKNNKKIIELKCYGWDKYGRLLAEFYTNGVNINKEMIDKNFGYPYDGGTKRV